MQKAQYHIITVALVAVFSCSTGTGNSYQFMRCYAELQKECRLEDKKLGLSHYTKVFKQEHKKTFQGTSFNIGQHTFVNYFTDAFQLDWGEFGLTKRVAQCVPSKYEIDIQSFLIYQFFILHFKQAVSSIV